MVRDRMKIVAIADMHGYLDTFEIPECDLLLIGGDVTPLWNHERRYQAQWLRGEFTDWLNSIKPTYGIVGIAGNHDFVLHDSKIGYDLPWKYLEDETVTIEGIKIHGTPWTPRFGAWTFMLPDGMLPEKWDKIPNDVDILLSHGPMYGHADVVSGYSLTKHGWEQSTRVGSKTMRHRVDYNMYPNMRLFVCGHIHEQYGIYPVDDVLTVYNVSHMNDAYQPVNAPIIIDWKS